MVASTDDLVTSASSRLTQMTQALSQRIEELTKEIHGKVIQSEQVKGNAS